MVLIPINYSEETLINVRYKHAANGSIEKSGSCRNHHLRRPFQNGKKDPKSPSNFMDFRFEFKYPLLNCAIIRENQIPFHHAWLVHTITSMWVSVNQCCVITLRGFHVQNQITMWTVCLTSIKNVFYCGTRTNRCFIVFLLVLSHQ